MSFLQASSFLRKCEITEGFRQEDPESTGCSLRTHLLSDSIDLVDCQSGLQVRWHRSTDPGFSYKTVSSERKNIIYLFIFEDVDTPCVVLPHHQELGWRQRKLV